MFSIPSNLWIISFFSTTIISSSELYGNRMVQTKQHPGKQKLPEGPPNLWGGPVGQSKNKNSLQFRLLSCKLLCKLRLNLQPNVFFSLAQDKFILYALTVHKIHCWIKWYQKDWKKTECILKRHSIELQFELWFDLLTLKYF